MHPSLTRAAATTVVGLLVAACTSAPSPVPTGAPTPSFRQVSSEIPSPPPTRAPTASPAAQTPTPRSVPAAAAGLPIRGRARSIGESVYLAPAPGAMLFVSVPRAGGSVLALLDRDGQPRPGWPITVKNSTSCGRPMPVDDGSVRIVCDGTDLPKFDNDLSDVRAFAFDSQGRLMDGWPVRLRPGSGAVIGGELRYLERQSVTDTYNDDTISSAAWITSVGSSSLARQGAHAAILGDCCFEWAIGPDGVAYGSDTSFDGGGTAVVASRLTAVDPKGLRAGFPVAFDGAASAASFDAAGRVVVATGSAEGGTSRVRRFAADGSSDQSAELQIATVESGVDCVTTIPMPPVTAPDGTTFLFNMTDVFALDPALEVLPGWPYRHDSPLTYRVDDDPHEGLVCGSTAMPAAGPDRTLYLPLQGGDESMGGSIRALDPQGRLRTGWPVALRRPGAEFWSIVVGEDGTVYALAVEPEAGGRSSASVLKILPDSTVAYRTSIVEP